MESIFDTAINLSNSLYKIIPLAAIWMTDNGTIQTETEKTCRITKGHKVRVLKGQIVNVTTDHPATHKIIECYGNISNTILYFEIENLKNGEQSKLNVK